MSSTRIELNCAWIVWLKSIQVSCRSESTNRKLKYSLSVRLRYLETSFRMVWHFWLLYFDQESFLEFNLLCIRLLLPLTLYVNLISRSSKRITLNLYSVIEPRQSIFYILLCVLDQIIRFYFKFFIRLIFTLYKRM